MTRLAIATVILAIALVVTRKKLNRRPGADALRVTARSGISRGVMAAVIETEERRFLVTITASSTTLIAELGTQWGAEAPAVDRRTAAPATPAGTVPTLADAAPETALIGPVPSAAPVIAAATPPTAPVLPTSAAPAPVVRPVRPPATAIPTFKEADDAVAEASLPRRTGGQPSAIAASADRSRPSLLDRARARTVRVYDLESAERLRQEV